MEITPKVPPMPKQQITGDLGLDMANWCKRHPYWTALIALLSIPLCFLALREGWRSSSCYRECRPLSHSYVEGKCYCATHELWTEQEPSF